MKEKKTKLMILALLITVLGVVGVSYAVWQLTRTQEGTNVITSGCFKITFTGQNDILLNNAYPISDEEGSALTPYTFTIKNECAAKANYVINLETISSGEKILSDEYIKANLKSGEESLFSNTLKSEFENVEKVIETATKAYKLTSGILNKEEEKTFDLRLWMDNDTPPEESVMNASYEGKITVIGKYASPIEKNLLAKANYISREYGHVVEHINTNYIANDKYQNTLNRIIFENIINPYTEAEEVIDLSEAKDESILGYFLKDVDSKTYTLYIQADGKIKLNPNSEYAFFTFYADANYEGEFFSNAVFSGFENIDTSKVTNMNHMFWKHQQILPDFTNWDTSNVTNMSAMFWDCNNQIILDLSSFDTSNVTNMSSMFFNMSSLASLNLNNFNTSKVTDMSGMFMYCNNLSTTINITNPNVENYESMFSGAATSDGAQITVNYTAETSDLVDRMIATKSANSNVVKGNLIS